MHPVILLDMQIFFVEWKYAVLIFVDSKVIQNLQCPTTTTMGYKYMLNNL